MYAPQEYSKLEQKIYTAVTTKSYNPATEIGGIKQNYLRELDKIQVKYEQKEYETQPVKPEQQEFFLNPKRPKTEFIGEITKIKHYITKTFQLLTGKQFPDTISIKLCKRDELKGLHIKFGGKWDEGIQGFAINTKPISQIFVKQNDLDRLMLTIGHEIGHVMSPMLQDQTKEEAKAFAFELAWTRTIAENGIAHLKHAFNLTPNPAVNGLHNVAFEMVKKEIDEGKQPMEIFSDLIKKDFSIDTMLKLAIYKTF